MLPRSIQWAATGSGAFPAYAHASFHWINDYTMLLQWWQLSIHHGGIFIGEKWRFLVHSLALSLILLGHLIVHWESLIVSLNLRCQADLVDIAWDVAIVQLDVSAAAQTMVKHVRLDSMVAKGWQALVMMIVGIWAITNLILRCPSVVVIIIWTRITATAISSRCLGGWLLVVLDFIKAC